MGYQVTSASTYVDVADNAALTFPTGDWYAHIWARSDKAAAGTTNAVNYLFSTGAFGESESINFFFDTPGGSNPGTLGTAIHDSGSINTTIYETSPPSWPGSTWTCLALRRRGTNIDLFADGVQVGTQDNGGSWADHDSPNPLNIGRRQDGNAARWFDGEIAEFVKITGTIDDDAAAALASGANPVALAASEAVTLDIYLPLDGDALAVTGPDGTLVGGISESATHPNITNGLTIEATGIASVETFGTTTITNVVAQTLTPASVSSGESFGAASLSHLVQSVLALGIATGEAFGASTIADLALEISVTGLPSSEAFGTTAVSNEGLEVITPAAIASLEAFGSQVIQGVVAQGVVAAGIVSTEAFGSAILNVLLQTIAPAGIPTGVIFGTTALEGGVPVDPSGPVLFVSVTQPVFMPLWTLATKR